METLYIFDLDNTLIDTKDAILDCQAKGLSKATSESISDLEKELRDTSLDRALKKRKIDKDRFFKEQYKTFDPYETAKNKKIRVFDDVELEKFEGTRAVISNSSQEAAFNKLDALGLIRHIDHLLAEYQKGKVKPSAYMAEMLAKKIEKEPVLIFNIGDDERDMEFGKSVAEVFSACRTINILIDREQNYNGKNNYDIKVASLEEIQKYAE